VVTVVGVTGTHLLSDGFRGFVEASTAYVRRVASAIAVEKIQFAILVEDGDHFAAAVTCVSSDGFAEIAPRAHINPTRIGWRPAAHVTLDTFRCLKSGGKATDEGQG